MIESLRVFSRVRGMAKRLFATLVMLGITCSPQAFATPMTYWSNQAEAMAQCQAEMAVLNTGCIPNTRSYAAWCKTWGVGQLAPGMYAFYTTEQEYLPGPPTYYCLNAIQTSSRGYAFLVAGCPAGTHFVGPSPTDCVADSVVQTQQESAAQLGRGIRDGKACTEFGNPCDAATGNKLQVETDFVGGDGVPSFIRTYNSLDPTNDAGIGVGWTHNHQMLLKRHGGSPETLTRMDSTGRRILYTRESDGTWSAGAGEVDTLTQDTLGFHLRYSDGRAEHYRVDGSLAEAVDRLGRHTAYEYSNGNLIRITGPYGHQITFSGTVVNLPNGYNIKLTLGPGYNLATAQYRNQSGYVYTTRTYLYENTSLPHALTGIKDELGNRIGTYAYDTTSGRAIRTERAGGIERFDFSYSSSQTVVTDAAGNIRTLAFQRIQNQNRLVSRTDADGAVLTQAYDSDGNITSITDEAGRIEARTWDSKRRLLSVTRAAGTPDAVTRTYTYDDPDLDQPATISTASVKSGDTTVISIAYDSARRPTSIIRSGYQPDGTPLSRGMDFTWSTTGQLTGVDGPRTDVSDLWAYEYWECTTGGACGQLKRITDPLGHVTNFNTYDGAGRLTQWTAPNGVVVTWTRDELGRISAMTETPPTGSARTVTLTYNAASDITQAVLPGGTTLTFTWMTSHKLASVTDQLGNQVSYTYDVRGNRNQEKTSNVTLARQVDWVFDLRNQLLTTSRDGAVTQTVFNAVGNLVTQQDANGHATNWTYDALDRMVSQLDPMNGSVTQTYDVQGAPDHVVTPNGAAWTYAHDDFGNALTEASPDRGQISRSFDGAGNAVSVTDGRGVTVSLTYDALNRATSISYPQPGDDVSLTWDTCQNGVGRLCSATDASGTRQYAYDGFGRVASVTWTSHGHQFTTSYSWNPDDRLASITYPSGRQVSYTRDGRGRITAIASSGQVLISNRSYRPDGLVLTQTYGNGLQDSRTYNLRGEMTAWVTGSADSRSYTYDLVGNMTSNAGTSYGYDALDRLTVAGTQGFGYDGNGNRVSDSTGTYSYLAGSNRLASSPAGAVSFDAAGNTTAIGSRSFTYNQAGRLATARVGGTVVGTYGYAFDGARTEKSASGVTTLFHYDAGGRLIATTDTFGSAVEEFVLDDDGTPIAQWANGTLTYLHADALGAPRFGTNSGGQVVWRAAEHPFATGPPTGQITVNLRLPGQYADQESGLFQNGFRSYDPALGGRYLESDPLGLAAGQFSTYGYVNGNPLRFSDPWGLCPLCPLFVVGLIANEIANSDVPIVGGSVAKAGGEAAAELAAKATAIHGALDPIAKSMRTTAVLRTNACDIAAGGARDLTRAQKSVALSVGATPVASPGTHAEVTAIANAQEQGFLPKLLEVTRDICPSCASFIETTGGTVTGPRSAKW